MNRAILLAWVLAVVGFACRSEAPVEDDALSPRDAMLERAADARARYRVCAASR